MKKIGALAFPKFELLDLFGPLEMFGVLEQDFAIEIVGTEAGSIASRQGPAVVVDATINDSRRFDMVLIPGGFGTRTLVSSQGVLSWLREVSGEARLVMSVCTGSALLAAAGLLDGRKATSNKIAFEWVMSQGPHVDWQKEARWVKDGKYYTSSGVAAGIDMSLGVIKDLLGEDTVRHVANWTEYSWNEDRDFDPFAKIHGLV